MIEKEHLLIENNNIKVLIKKIEQKGQKQIDGLGSNKFFNSFEEFLKAL